ncbi:hypothetical protein [Winogradskyella aurantiaca]|uniref:hypothetical protein n=1 Tax=Winogradskyella aurantiaca TaxID=2219558 RepID=UPI000E1C7BF2|nr:hypothetical protein [Winogradskyella aurantiaca]
MFKNHWREILKSALLNGLFLSAILAAIVYTFKSVFRPDLIALWFVFFFVTGGYRKWRQIKIKNIEDES